MKDQQLTTNHSQPTTWRWLEALPVIWLALAISPYALLAVYPMQATQAEVPGVAEAERAVLPLLLSLVVAAIIQYFPRRNMRSPTGAAAAPDPEEGRERA